MPPMDVPEVTYCVVNTGQRELLLRGLDAIARERAAVPFSTAVLVLDNASDDGSAQAARAHPAGAEVIALERRTAKAINDSELMRRTRGPFSLLLNEDSELLPGATAALHAALVQRPDAACAGAALRRPDGRAQASAWAFPGPRPALLAALGLTRYAVQSRGGQTREVDWCQSAAMLVRRTAAAQIGFMDPVFFVYSDEVDFQKRLHDAGWRNLWVPAAVAIHHEQLSTGAAAERRIVEMARNRDRYMRKHHSRAAALAVRVLSAWAYAIRALAALALPGHDARRYRRHVLASLFPARGEGIREAAEAYNAARSADMVGPHVG
jgi:N-acetylglucosaminyl-diphospho-decaprenol L-rhamnosyltransferase